MVKKMLHSFFENIENGGLQVEYWDQEIREYGDDKPKLKLIFNEAPPSSLDFSDPMIAFGEAYMEDIIDFEGNFDEVLKIAKQNKAFFKGKQRNLLKATSKLLNKNDIREKQKENIYQHYDIGNDFFSLWLDETMSYSCGYFKGPEDTLFEAQMNKIDHVLKKLQLQPGEKLLDIGSGWGWLIIRAARKYGVKATGVTISEEQYKKTVERIEKLGLSDQVEVKLQDYLDLDGENLQFDKIVSVGMYEHVGKENLDHYLTKVEELLVPGGISMLHAIMGTREGQVNSWIRKYIFPGGYIPSLRETISLFPEHDFHLLHGESLRMHYAMTLDRWYENYLKHWDEVEHKYGRRFARMWELYLKGCAANFRVSGLNIYQLIFTKDLNNDLALTLDHVYQ